MPILAQRSSATLPADASPADRRLFIAGAILAAITAVCYGVFYVTHPADRLANPVDLQVYRAAGQVVAHMRPGYHPGLASPLYDWPGLGLKFTYPPFAAVVFTIFALPPWHTLQSLWLTANIVALVATIWLTLGRLGYRAGLARLGGTLLLAAVLFWTEPVQRTMYLGQVELALMLLVVWDLCQPDGRKWKGIGVGLAAGIKLVPLIFVPYLLFTRRYREAAVAAATFVATVIIGFVVLPADSRKWWLDGLLFKSGRTGFTGWAGNQSLQGIITRLSGSIVGGEPIWMVVAVIVLVGGVACGVALQRAGHDVLGMLACALTGLLVSPISWDHHWVWIVPGVTALVVYGVRTVSRLRWVWLAGGVLVTALFGAWPGFLWGEPQDLGGFSEGLIWAPRQTPAGDFARIGDQAWYYEYHWHGIQLLVGNLYVLTGCAVLLVAAILVVRGVLARRRDVPAEGLGPVSPAPAVSP